VGIVRDLRLRRSPAPVFGPDVEAAFGRPLSFPG
jgi:hypothetical protein